MIFSFSSKVINFSLIIFLSVSLVACGGAGNPDRSATNTNGSTSDSTTSNLLGSVGDGPITGATITIYSSTGDVIDSTVSTSSASYQISVHTRRQSYPLVFTSTGGIDIVTNTPPDFTLSSVALSPADRKVVNLNPYTTFITKTAALLPGGINDSNIALATQYVVNALNFGLDTTLIPSPISTEIDDVKISNFVKSSEVLGEAIRRTRTSLVSQGISLSYDEIIDAISADLTDGDIDGIGAMNIDPRISATLNLVSAQVGVEAIINNLNVNGTLATTALDNAIITTHPNVTATDLTNNVTINQRLIGMATASVNAANAISTSPDIDNILSALNTIPSGSLPSYNTTILPSGSSSAIGNVITLLASASSNTLNEINSIASIEDTEVSPPTGINQAPVLFGNPPTAVTAGNTYSFTIRATDPESAMVNWHIYGLPGWAAFVANNNNTATLSGVPTENDIGMYENIQITATDGVNIVYFPAFSIQVTAGTSTTPPTNTAPSILGIPPSSIIESNYYNFTVTASDVDNDALSFNIVNRPNWATFVDNGDNTATLSGTPQGNDVGIYQNISISVSDGIEATNLQAFAIEVLANTPPPPTNEASYTVTPTSGVVSLTVNFEAAQSELITNYSWDFGDGNNATGPSAVHIYSTPGSYTTRLTVTDTNGDSYSAESIVHVFASVDNTSVIVPDSIMFYDDFDYAAGRDDINAATTFRNVGGWNGAKTVQSGETGARGYVYTVDRIPGYSGPFPGRNSTHVLVQEAAGATMGGQTDFYLEYGDESASDETIPGNVWFQFWVYPNYYDDPADQEDQLSDFGHRMKFIYPCRGGYPCHDGSWLFMLGTTSNQPFFDELGVPGHDLYLNLADFEDMDYTLDAQYPENNWKLGHNDLSELLERNRWTLVKMHIDTSTTSGRWEAWLKPMGGEWVKIADWADGQAGLNWNVSVPGGHRVFRMPTTIGGGAGWYDSWLYMDDFAMATSENDLPVYPY